MCNDHPLQFQYVSSWTTSIELVAMDTVIEIVISTTFRRTYVKCCEVFSFPLSKLGMTFITSLTFLQVLSHTSIKLTPLT